MYPKRWLSHEHGDGIAKEEKLEQESRFTDGNGHRFFLDEFPLDSMLERDGRRER